MGDAAFATDGEISPTELNPESRSGLLIVCDHASNIVPTKMKALGLSKAELHAHIAWDIGSQEVSFALAERFGCTAVLAPVSRLVIDCNRYIADHSSIPVHVDGRDIPGNFGLTVNERGMRVSEYFVPYHLTIGAHLDRLDKLGIKPLFVSIHSMTRKLRSGKMRPWDMALSRAGRNRCSDFVLTRLREAGVSVGDNEPYSLDVGVDYTTCEHALRRGLPYLQVEFAQDLVSDPHGVVRWAAMFGDALEILLKSNLPIDHRQGLWPLEVQT